MSELLHPTGEVVSERVLKNNGIDVVQFYESESCYVRLFIEFDHLGGDGYLCSIQYCCSKSKDCDFPNRHGTYGHLLDLEKYEEIEDLWWGDSWLKMGTLEVEVHERCSRVVDFCRDSLLTHAIKELRKAEPSSSHNAG